MLKDRRNGVGLHDGFVEVYSEQFGKEQVSVQSTIFVQNCFVPKSTKSDEIPKFVPGNSDI